MRFLKTTILCLGYLAILAVAHYELAYYAPRLLEQPLPGWRESYRAELTTPMNHHTGWHLLDRMLHEGEETVCFYHLLLAGG